MINNRNSNSGSDFFNALLKQLSERMRQAGSRRHSSGAPQGLEKRPGGSLFRRAAAVVVLLLGLLYLAGSGSTMLYRVSEQEQAVVTRFGKVTDVKTAGLYFCLPFVDHVHKVRTTTYGMPIGYQVMDGSAGENGNASSIDSESLMITSDFNFVNTDFYIEYRVSDPVKYLYNSSDPEGVLKNLAQAMIRSTVSDYKVDDVMTTGKAQVQAEVREKLVKSLEEVNIGLEIVNISIQDVEPPTAEVMTAFKSVENAKQGSETAINNANKYKSEQIPAAEAGADRIIQAAEAGKEARIAEAEGQVARFNAMYEQYTQNPLITRQRMFYETMEELLPDLKVIISDGGTQTMLPLAPFTAADSGADNAGSGSNAGQGSMGGTSGTGSGSSGTGSRSSAGNGSSTGNTGSAASGN